MSDRWGVPDREPAKSYRNQGKLDDALQSTLTMGPGQFLMFLHQEGATNEKGILHSTESGPAIDLAYKTRYGRSVTIKLTDMTAAELQASEDFLRMVFEIARPIVLERDADAHAAFARGDDSFSRVYRAVPQLVVRARAKRLHSQILRVGLEAVVAMGWDLFRAHWGTGVERAEVAPGDASTGDAEDHTEAPD